MSLDETVTANAPQTIRESRRISARRWAATQPLGVAEAGDLQVVASLEAPRTAPDSEATVRLAQSPWDHLQAFHLLYEQYLHFGYTQPNEGRLRISRWNCCSGSHTFVAERRGQVAGTITCLEDGPTGVPAEQSHAAPLHQLRASGRRFVEMTSLAVAPVERGPSTLLQLIRIAVTYCRGMLGASDWVCTVNPRHVRFYRKVMLFEELGAATACGTVNGAPGVLLRLNLSSMEERYRWRYGTREGALNLHQFFFDPVGEAARLAQLRETAEKRRQNLEVLQQVLRLLAA